MASSFAALPIEWMIGARVHADWGSLDALKHTSNFHLPILLFHGTEDKPCADLSQRRSQESCRVGSPITEFLTLDTSSLGTSIPRYMDGLLPFLLASSIEELNVGGDRRSETLVITYTCP